MEALQLRVHTSVLQHSFERAPQSPGCFAIPCPTVLSPTPSREPSLSIPQDSPTLTQTLYCVQCQRHKCCMRTIVWPESLHLRGQAPEALRCGVHLLPRTGPVLSQVLYTVSGHEDVSVIAGLPPAYHKPMSSFSKVPSPPTPRHAPAGDDEPRGA